MKERILSKLDEYLGKNDYTSAEKHLLYWLSEAKAGGNHSAQLLVCNELMGLYRKLNRKEEAIQFAEAALEKIHMMHISENVGAATTYINCATVYKAFGMAEKSMPFFQQAQNIYERMLDFGDARLGGLYNNMALALVDLSRFDEANMFYQKALNAMKHVPNGKPEMAITYLNMASAVEAEFGLAHTEEKISEYLDKAMVLLDTCENNADGNYAFVCEKCASVFGYYGYFLYEKELKNRARSIYEGS